MKSLKLGLLFLGSLFLYSCKDAKPQLIALLGGQQSPSSGSVSQTPPKGGISLGAHLSGTATVGATTYNIRGRVAIVPQHTVGTATVGGTTYKIRGRVEL